MGIDPEEVARLKAKERDEGDKGTKDTKELRSRIEGEFQPKVDKLTKELEDERAARRKETIERSVTEALAGANISKDLLEAAKDHILTRRKVDVADGGATIDGKPAAEFMKTWATTDGKAFVAAPDNSGGGARGGGGGGAASGKKLAEMSAAGKAAHMRSVGSEAYKTCQTAPKD